MGLRHGADKPTNFLEWHCSSTDEAAVIFAPFEKDTFATSVSSKQETFSDDVARMCLLCRHTGATVVVVDRSALQLGTGGAPFRSLRLTT